ncbi:MAG: ATP-binding protein, partial [Chitinophagaceae bacterium]
MYFSPNGLATLLCEREKATQECPCGFYNHPDRECTCPPGTVQKYLNKVSGPLLDRIDLHVEVTPV